MESLEEGLYSAAFRKWKISPSSKKHGYGPCGILRTFENEFGEGEYWSYFRGNLYAINSFRMKFKKDWILKYRCIEHLCVSFYDEIEGMTQKQGAPLSVGAISVYLGGEGEEYEARVSEGASTKGTSITFSPDYYRTYLQSRFGSVEDMRRAFLEADGRHDMPELVNLLRKARNYKGAGIAAELFYEGVISEAVATVVQHSSLCPDKRGAERLSREDRRAIDYICGYIASNLGGRPFLLPSCRRTIHRADEIKGPLQGSDGDAPILLRRTRAHGGSIQAARRVRLHGSRNRKSGRLRQTRRIHGSVPKRQGLHAYTVQKAAMAE